jgi:acyl-coenzyme A thioesterase 13
VRSHLHLLSATATPAATVTYAFTVTPAFCNRFGALHGGAAALIFDICTTTALATVARPGFWLDGGVSRNLNVTYLRPVMAGTECLVEGEVVQAGRRLCEFLCGVLLFFFFFFLSSSLP